MLIASVSFLQVHVVAAVDCNSPTGSTHSLKFSGLTKTGFVELDNPEDSDSVHLILILIHSDFHLLKMQLSQQFCCFEIH